MLEEGICVFIHHHVPVLICTISILWNFHRNMLSHSSHSFCTNELTVLALRRRRQLRGSRRTCLRRHLRRFRYRTVGSRFLFQ